MSDFSARGMSLAQKLSGHKWRSDCDVRQQGGHGKAWRVGDCDGHTFGVYLNDAPTLEEGTPLITGLSSELAQWIFYSQPLHVLDLTAEIWRLRAELTQKQLRRTA